MEASKAALEANVDLVLLEQLGVSRSGLVVHGKLRRRLLQRDNVLSRAPHQSVRINRQQPGSAPANPAADCNVFAHRSVMSLSKFLRSLRLTMSLNLPSAIVWFSLSMYLRSWPCPTASNQRSVRGAITSTASFRPVLRDPSTKSIQKKHNNTTSNASFAYPLLPVSSVPPFPAIPARKLTSLSRNSRKVRLRSSMVAPETDICGIRVSVCAAASAAVLAGKERSVGGKMPRRQISKTKSARKSQRYSHQFDEKSIQTDSKFEIWTDRQTRQPTASFGWMEKRTVCGQEWSSYALEYDAADQSRLMRKPWAANLSAS